MRTFRLSNDDRVVVLRRAGSTILKVPREVRIMQALPLPDFQEPVFVKDPEAVKDYWIDWSRVLPQGARIGDAFWTASGLEIRSRTIKGMLTGVVLAGGEIGQVYPVTCRIWAGSGDNWYAISRWFRIHVRRT